MHKSLSAPRSGILPRIPYRWQKKAGSSICKALKLALIPGTASNVLSVPKELLLLIQGEWNYKETSVRTQRRGVNSIFPPLTHPSIAFLISALSLQLQQTAARLGLPSIAETGDTAGFHAQPLNRSACSMGNVQEELDVGAKSHSQVQPHTRRGCTEGGLDCVVTAPFIHLISLSQVSTFLCVPQFSGKHLISPKLSLPLFAHCAFSQMWNRGNRNPYHLIRLRQQVEQHDAQAEWFCHHSPMQITGPNLGINTKLQRMRMFQNPKRGTSKEKISENNRADKFHWNLLWIRVPASCSCSWHYNTWYHFQVDLIYQSTHNAS